MDTKFKIPTSLEQLKDLDIYFTPAIDWIEKPTKLLTISCCFVLSDSIYGDPKIKIEFHKIEPDPMIEGLYRSGLKTTEDTRTYRIQPWYTRNTSVKFEIVDPTTHKAIHHSIYEKAASHLANEKIIYGELYKVSTLAAFVYQVSNSPSKLVSDLAKENLDALYLLRRKDIVQNLQARTRFIYENVKDIRKKLFIPRLKGKTVAEKKSCLFHWIYSQDISNTELELLNSSEDIIKKFSPNALSLLIGDK